MGKLDKKIDDYYIPASFRVGDDSIRKSSNCAFVKYIFSKKDKFSNYKELCYGNENKISELPKEIKDKLDMVKMSSF